MSKYKDVMVEVPADLIEDIHYHLSIYDTATSKSRSGHHLTELHNKVSDLTTWHPGHDVEHGTMPWEREDEA